MMNPSSAMSTSSTAGAPTELVWRGRAVTQAQAAAAFFLGSLLVAALGVAVNYGLTDGLWHTQNEGIKSAFGSSPEYLTTSPYDVVTLLILLTALIFLGAGFLAAYQPALHGRSFLTLLVLAATFAAAWGLNTAGILSQGEPLLLATLAAAFGLLALTWFLAAFIGGGTRMHQVRAVGFVLFGFYWATQAMKFYYVEEGDFVNSLFALLAVFFFNYFAYQELLSIRRNEDPRALQWLAGAAFLTTGLYVFTHKLEVVSEWLIVTVAAQTTWLLQWFGQAVVRVPDYGGDIGGASMIGYPTSPGTMSDFWFPIQIILACTAIQSIMIFVGGIAALRPPRRGDGLSGRVQHFERLRPTYQQRRLYALLLVVPLIYALNLLRNVLIISMSADGTPWLFFENESLTEFTCQFSTDAACNSNPPPADSGRYEGWYHDRAASAAFWFGHNIVGKGGSLVALIVIAFMVFQVLPELYDSIVGLIDLKDRRGPLERWFGDRLGRRGNGGTRAPAPAAAPAPETKPSPMPDRLGHP